MKIKWNIDELEEPKTAVRFLAGTTHFLFSTDWVTEALSSGVKRPGSKADHSPPCSAEIKNTWTHHQPPKHDVVLNILKKVQLTFPQFEREAYVMCMVSFVCKFISVTINCF
jgi:hypothetical protein